MSNSPTADPGSATTSSATLCMDAGQSGIRAMVRTGSESSRQVDLPGVVNDGTLVAQLAVPARTALTGLGADAEGVRQVAIGATGFHPDEDTTPILDAVRPLGVRIVHLAHDSTTSYLGALGDRPGAVVAAGTGVVTLGVGATEVARVDGWGYLIGNAGAGSWIGRMAMTAVMRAHDGRGPATALTGYMEQLYPDLEVAYLQLAADPERVPLMGRFAIRVAELADTDEVAASISADAGRELAWSAATALRRVGELGTGAPASCLGSVFTSAAIRRAFASVLAEVAPGAEIVRAQGTSLEGAAWLPGIDPASALGRRIVRVG